MRHHPAVERTTRLRAGHPAKTVQELVNYAKQNPDKANYGASSASFQLITELFNSQTGARFAHIPYKGSNDSISAVMAGDVTMTLVDAGAASAALQGGRISALSVTPTASTSEDFARLIASEIPLWKRVALDKHIQPN